MESQRFRTNAKAIKIVLEGPTEKNIDIIDWFDTNDLQIIGVLADLFAYLTWFE